MTETTRALERGVDYFQAPAPFEIAEEVTLSTGERLGGGRARVYGLLRGSVERRFAHHVGRHLAPVGWVPNFLLREPWSGGNAGDRRLRDLRERGVQLESAVFTAPNGERSNTTLWRWVGDGSALHPGTTPANPPQSALGGLMRGFGGQEASSGRAPQSSRSQGRSARGVPAADFWTSVGFPGSEAPDRLEVTPGARSALAPWATLLTQIVHGVYTAETAAEAYRDRLRSLFASGGLRRELERFEEPTFWVEAVAAETFNPLPVLTEALVACGGRHLGDWQTRNREGVA